MVETGKRPRSIGEQQSGDDKNNKKRGGSKDEKGDGYTVVYRILCPEGHVGSVIGKGGKMVKSIRNETGAKVTVVDPHPGCKERVIILHCHIPEKEEVEIDDGFADEKLLCSSQSALFKVHSVITETVQYSKDSEKDNDKDYAECHLLVPSSQVANVIGKSGSTIKKLRSKTRANVAITPKDPMDPSHSCAYDFDNFVKVTGEVGAVRQALFGISAIMYKFSPREDISLEKSVPGVHPPSFIIPSDVPMYPPGGGFFPAFDPTIRTGPMLPSSHAAELPPYPDPGNMWPVYPSGFSGFGGGPSRSEELVVRVLCPMDKIGRVIGKSGASIKALRQSTGASVEVDDSKNNAVDECAITIKSTESTDDRKSMAVDVVLLLQSKICDADDEGVAFRLLLPMRVVGFVIGKGGSVINEIRKSTGADIQISKSAKPKCAGSNEELMEVNGGVSNVRDALVQIVTRLRENVLKENDMNPSLPDFAGRNPYPAPVSMPHSSGSNPLGCEYTADPGAPVMPMIPSGGLYGYGPPPPIQGGENGYGGGSSYSSKYYGGGGLVPPPVTSAFEMLVPSNAVGKVMGKSGANIANIRNLSGASIEISDAKSVRGDRIALISGTPEQKKAAEGIIQAFIMSI